MTVRPLRESDLPILKAISESSGFPYVDPRGPHVETLLVVADDEDRPVMACAAERIVQLYLWAGDLPPGAKLAAIRLLHKAMIPALKEKGYDGATAFIPPQLALSFGKRLVRMFGFVRNWPSFTRLF